jgi:hypothetical protein
MGPRDFDAGRLAQAEFDGWVAYYRRDWSRVLSAAVRMVHLGFGMSPRRTLRGAWLVLRANQLWAPYPDNDPQRAREYMQRFYELVIRDGQLSLDAAEGARLEVEWWRIHRLHQRENQLTEDDLVRSLVELYGYVYGAAPEAVRPAAEHRVVAMRHSDEWVRAGCRRDDPALAAERSELGAAYRELLAAVRRS